MDFFPAERFVHAKIIKLFKKIESVCGEQTVVWLFSFVEQAVADKLELLKKEKEKEI